LKLDPKAQEQLAGSWPYVPQDGWLFRESALLTSRKAKPEEKRLGYMSEAEFLKAVREVFPNARIIGRHLAADPQEG
jgi:hypothetical protein